MTKYIGDSKYKLVGTCDVLCTPSSRSVILINLYLKGKTKYLIDMFI
jgi:hypothetical protein